MHTRHGEIGLPHFLSKPVHLPLRIAKDNRLRNRKGIIQLPLAHTRTHIGSVHHTMYQTSNLPSQQQ
jgi:hypothetical protein